ncbi:MAG: DsrE family protein [Tannerella sp.]|jgi:hypothetical protein|nr:DsrE family protein [Tannerella sp.]
MDKLHILWTTDNKDTIFNMLSMYAINSKRRGWWKEVNVILWGASVKLAGNDTQVQTEILEMQQHGISVEACKDCCDNFNVAEVLLKLGINVRYMGEPMTAYIKAGEKLICI